MEILYFHKIGLKSGYHQIKIEEEMKVKIS